MSAAIGYVTGTGTASSLADPLVRAYWSDKLHQESLNDLFWTARGMVASLTAGETDDEDALKRMAAAPLISIDDFDTKRTQRVRLALMKQLIRNRGLADRAASSGGIAAATFGVTTMIAAEEVLDLYDTEVLVEQYKHATAFDTPEIQDLRTSFRMDRLARTALSTWMTDQKEELVNDAFEDGYAAHVIRAGLASAVTHPNKTYAGAGTSDETVGNDGTLSLALLRKLYAKARHHTHTVSAVAYDNPLNPIKIGGGEYFALCAPAFALNDLMADPTFRQTMERVLPRGEDHPLLTRAAVVIEGICVHEYNRVRHPTSGAERLNKYHLPFLGAKAIVIANASKPRLVIRKEDEYEDRYGVGIKWIGGTRRVDFSNSADTVDLLNQSSIMATVFASSTL